MMYAFVTLTNRLTKRAIKTCIVGENMVDIGEKVKTRVQKQGEYITRNGGQAVLTIELGKVEEL